MVDSRGHTVHSIEIERVFREAYVRAVATLVRYFGDIALAEDAVQDAFLTASDQWPSAGIPPNPAGWIVTTARNRAVDLIRRSARGSELERRAVRESPVPEANAMYVDAQTSPVDDRLRLIFTCCHPALRTEDQVALTLRLLGGLDVSEVARSFLVTEPAMAKRLVRAKYKIKVAKIPYRVPGASEMPGRLRSVLLVVYLIYNAGFGGDDRAELRAEAIRLGRLISELMPDEPEATGLLALMVLSDAREPARYVEGASVLLRDQDRSLWDRVLIREGHALVRACIRLGRPGPFQVQAAIQAMHCAASSFEATDWPGIVTLYDQLYSLTPTPVVALNRAIAVGEVSGPEAELAALAEVQAELDTYHLLHAARGAALWRLGNVVEAKVAFQRAGELATADADRRFLARQLGELERATGR